MTAFAAVLLPIATLQVKVDLPPAIAPVSAAPVCPRINLTIRTKTHGVDLFVNDRPTRRQSLLLELSKIRTCAPNATTVMIRADRQIRYRDFTAVADELRKGGYVIPLALVAGDNNKPSS